MTTLKVNKITSFRMGLVLGCHKCTKIERYIITVLDDTNNPELNNTCIVLCEDCFKELMTTGKAHIMSVN